MARRLSATGKPLGRPPKAPEAPDTRAINRAAKVLARYDAAGMGRRMAGWTPPRTGPNTALNGIQRIRDRAQDTTRNDWAAESTAAKWTSSLIGIGITPRFKGITDVERRKVITALFLDMAKKIDADCVLDYFGQQTLVFAVHQIQRRFGLAQPSFTQKAGLAQYFLMAGRKVVGQRMLDPVVKRVHCHVTQDLQHHIHHGQRG